MQRNASKEAKDLQLRAQSRILTGFPFYSTQAVLHHIVLFSIINFLVFANSEDVFISKNVDMSVFDNDDFKQIAFVQLCLLHE